MEGQTSERFAALETKLRSALTTEQIALLDRVKAIEPCRRGCRGFENLGAEVVRNLASAARIDGASERRNFSRALIANLASRTLERGAMFQLTPRIFERIQAWLVFLADFLEKLNDGEYAYPEDRFCKDYRFVTLMTVPCGAQVVDLNDGVGPKTALALATRHPIASVHAYLSSWFRVHTESRYLDEFNDFGWQACYRELAQLLALHPNIRGMAATSWFYDPNLGQISPRLAYLRALPMACGAFSVRHGTTLFDIRSATATSSSRRALHEAGRYDPVCYSILWDRVDIIKWAEAHPG